MDAAIITRLLGALPLAGAIRSRKPPGAGHRLRPSRNDANDRALHQYEMAEYLTGVGRLDEAFELIDDLRKANAAISSQLLWRIHGSAEFEPVRNDARYASFLKTLSRR